MPDKLGHYDIVSLLGKGGMGEVYRAHDSRLEREVALKILPEELGRDPERLARFRREAHTLASLNHRNIAAIYGFETAPEATFLAMELVDGGDLEAFKADAERVVVEQARCRCDEPTVGDDLVIDHRNQPVDTSAIELRCPSLHDLSARHINDRHLPDKAIDALDEAGSRVHIDLSARFTGESTAGWAAAGFARIAGRRRAGRARLRHRRTRQPVEPKGAHQVAPA